MFWVNWRRGGGGREKGKRGRIRGKGEVQRKRRGRNERLKVRAHVIDREKPQDKMMKYNGRIVCVTKFHCYCKFLKSPPHIYNN